MARRRHFTPLPKPPLPQEDRHVARVGSYAAVVAGLVSVLVGRLWLLQIVRGETYRNLADENRSRTVRTTAPRGAIVDADGQTLVANGAQFSVFLHQDEAPKASKKGRSARKAAKSVLDEEYLDRVAALVDLTRAELDEILRTKQGRTSDPIPIRENIDRHLMARIYERVDSLQGISIEVVPVRTYPLKSRASHVLGYTAAVTRNDLDNKALLDYPEEKQYHSGDSIGRTGIEKTYDRLLRGTSGWESFEVDRQGHRRREVMREQAEAGATLHLSLHARVQEAAEKALAGRTGAVVALDPRSGRVLALVSAPTYDLGWRTHPFSKTEYKDYIAPGELNRALRAFPPGSTYKIVTSAAGVGEGKIGDDTNYFCNGALMLGKHYRKKCHGSHGGVGLTQALAVSCDVFYYHVGMNLGPDKMAEWARRFGLDHATGIDLPGEMGGIVPDPAWKEAHAAEGATTWYPGDSANTAIGQGDVTATPLQMALVSSAIANGGTVYEPRVVEKATAADNPQNVLYQVEPKAYSELGLSQTQIERIRRGMRACVTSGTSRSAEVGGGVRVYGKSGSAEKRGGQEHGATYGWFTCYAEREGKPAEIAVCAMLEPVRGQNYHGGEVCAPIAKRVIEAYYFGDKHPTPAPRNARKKSPRRN